MENRVTHAFAIHHFVNNAVGDGYIGFYMTLSAAIQDAIDRTDPPWKIVAICEHVYDASRKPSIHSVELVAFVWNSGGYIKQP